MNESGRSVRAALDFYKLTPQDVPAFYDELDLTPMRVKVKQGGGAAGHKGIRSMINHIAEDFSRIRIGIGHPGNKDSVTGVVLGSYHQREQQPLIDLPGALAPDASTHADGHEARSQEYGR